MPTFQQGGHEIKKNLFIQQPDRALSDAVLFVVTAIVAGNEIEPTHFEKLGFDCSVGNENPRHAVLSMTRLAYCDQNRQFSFS